MLLSLILACASFSGCKGEELPLEETPFRENISAIAGLDMEIVESSKEEITYRVRNTSDTGFCYEGHFLALLQKEAEGDWYYVRLREDHASTLSFIYASIPEETEEHVLDVIDYYGIPLTKGHYRLLALGYSSMDALAAADPESRIYIGAEFDIK